MGATPSTRPPNLALALLTRRLPRAEAEDIVGDLTEAFAERVSGGRRFNRLWFWGQGVTFVVAFAARGRAGAPRDMRRRRTGQRNWLDALRQDIRDGIRALRHSPAFLTIAVLTLALGIGANVAIFTLVNTVLLQPLPFPNPNQLVRVFDDLSGAGANDVGMSVPEFEDLRLQSGVFEQLSAILPASAALAGGAEVDRIELLGTSPSYFEMLGVKAQLGRVYRPSDWVPGFVDGVVISDGLWKRQFGGDPSVVGRRIRVDQDGYTVIGVMPPAFHHPGETLAGQVDVWAATGFVAPPFPSPPIRGARLLPGAMGRLAHGLTIDLAQERLDAFTAQLAQRYPSDYPARAKWSIRLEPVQRSLVGNVGPTLLVLLLAVGLVLLVVCVNIASLLVARSSGRTREFAIRQALGASGGRLLRQLLTENLLISLCGGTAAIAGLALARRSLLSLMPADLPRLNELHVDWRVLAVACGLALLTGVLFGIAPALQASGLDPNHSLKEGGRTGTGQSLRQARSRAGLVILEVALSVVLLTSAGLLLRSFALMLQQKPGLNPTGLTVGQIWVPVPNNPQANPYVTAPQRAALARALLLQFRMVPGVDAAAVSSATNIPFLHGPDNPVSFSLPDEMDADQHPHAALFGAVSADYFKVIGTPIEAGRDFSDLDTETTRRVVIVNEAFARTFLSRKQPIGQRWRDRAGRDYAIIGIVGDVRDEGLDIPPKPRIYASVFQISSSAFAAFFRTRPGVDLEAVLTEAVHRVDPNLAVFGVQTMDALMAETEARRRFSLSLMTAFALVALFLAALGLYGVMAFAVSQRTQEFGIRLALGAEPRAILMLAFRPAVILTCTGLVIGLAISAVVSRVMVALLFEVTPSDPLTFATVPAVLAIAVLSASLIPARRAARVSPLQALRG